MVESRKFFYSKILLFGEYTVTTGSGALAIPFDGFGGYWDFNSENKVICTGLDQLYNYISSTSGLEKLYALNKFNDDLAKGLYFESDIPQGYGLGSSGAVVAAFYDRYALIKTENIQALKTILADIECAFHGSSSGIDPLVSYLGQPIWIQENGNIELLDLQISNSGFFLIDTGITRQTGPLVEMFKSKKNNSALFRDAVKTLSLQNQKGMMALLSNNKNQFASTVKCISQLQYEYFSEMIPDAFRNLWFEGLNSHQYYLKLCGAGGGGMIMGWTEDMDKIKNKFKNYSIISI